MADKYKVIISDRAKKMLGEHIRFLAQVNKAAAAKKKEIMAAMRSLCQMPQRFPHFVEPYVAPGKYRKMYIANWYIVLYKITGDTVYVEYVLDCRKEENQLTQ